MLTDRQKEVIVEHLNSRITKGELAKCAFCIVAEDLRNEDSRLNGWRSFCDYCPLYGESSEFQLNCVNIRKLNLRTVGNEVSTFYYAATEESILKHVDFMMNKVNKFWNLNLTWKNTIEGRRVFIPKEKRASDNA